MSRSNIGTKIPNLRTISTTDNIQLYEVSNKWIALFIGPNASYPTYKSLCDHNNCMNCNYVEFLMFNTNADSPCIYIIDPNHVVQAVLYEVTDTPTTASNITHVIQSFSNNYSTNYSIDSTSDYRTQIQNINNQPSNPNCPALEPLVGEYVLGNPKNVDPMLNDFLIYAFALIQPDGSLKVYSEKYLKELSNLRYSNPNLKVVMAIGGWGNEGFSDAALTPTSRYDFAREVKKWVDEYCLDGVDIDWEYPGSSVAGIKSRKEDRENFTLLLTALRDVLGQSSWLSVAGIADNGYIRNVDIPAISKIIDYFNLMSYDFTAGSTGTNGAKHHSNLFVSDCSLPNISTDIYIQNLLSAGMPSEKILMGIPFYGRNGSSVTKTFDDIRKHYINKDGYQIKWDNDAKVPYIVDPKGNFFLSYDNALSIYFKGNYIYNNCLGGMFSWQAGMDQANILLNYMYIAMHDPDKLEETLSKNYYR
ncbi:MAG: glycoside hydrolase family 18 protein [Cellulosilyticaceae bacterium]